MKNVTDFAICKKCGKTFKPRSNYSFFCDVCCTCVCKFCGIKFYRRPKKNRISQFCSIKCTNKWQQSPEGIKHHKEQKLKERGTGKNIVCDNCGKTFYRMNSRLDFKNRYCSWKCRRIGKVLICPVCNKKFRRPPSDIKNATINYCSDECRNIGILQRRENGELFVPDTKPERMGREILEQLNIPFIEQKAIGFYLVDVLIQPNIVIQWDGDFWHGNPKKFLKLTPVQKKNVQRDKRCDTYLKKRNYKILRFWESDLQNNPLYVSSRIKKVLESSCKT